MLFWFTAVLNLAGELMQFIPLRLATKPLLMIFLGVWFFQKTAGAPAAAHKLTLAALAFSWLGDILLMFKTEIFFMLGLSAFLLAHLFYILTFRNEIQKEPGKTLLRSKPYAALPLLLIFAGLIIFLYPKIEPFMRLPVIVYACIITVMALAALNRWKKVNEMSFWPVMAGALIFMISDSIIAINKFAATFVAASFFIMLLYIIAQYLIAQGIAKNRTL